MTLPPFLERIKDDVIRIKKETGSKLKVSVALAQCALESDYGQSELARNANNFAGHKYDKNIHKDFYIKDAYEYENGQEVVDENAKWGKYTDFNDFCKSHFNWFTSNPTRTKIYANVLSATTADRQAYYLMGTYATDLPRPGSIGYYQKLMNIINQNDLTQFDTEKETTTVSKLTLEQAFAKLGLTFKKQLLPLTKTFGRVNRKEGIVIHQTGAPQVGKTAQWMANYQKSMSSPSNGEEKSWNYQVDDKEVIMSFEHNVATWQASDGSGPGNMAHISIESCINSDGNYAKGIDNLAKTMAVIAYVEGFNIEKNTKRHYDFARDKKWCPAQIMNGKEGFTYAKVKQMAQAHLDTLNGAVATPVDVHNPQGLQETKPLDYTAPRLPFEQLKVGDKVTLLDDKNANGDYIWLWYNPTNNTLLKSKKQAELAGTTDTIKEVKRIDKIQHSQYAYLLANTNSWILEEYLEEPRRNWEVVVVEDEDKVEDGKEVQPLEDGQFWWNDVLYQISEVK